jgi:DNA-directed RNA polymerase subunit RPC12/RpoP
MTGISGVFYVLTLIVVGLFLWVLNAFVAAAVAPEDRSKTFFWLTLLILGPLGVAAAAVAQTRDSAYVAPPKRPIATGRRRFVCPRCGAENDIPESSRSYDCWRCTEHRKVEAPKSSTAKPPTKSTPPAKPAAPGKG